MADQFDYVIVGAGTAGCVLANRLTACGTYSVCLLEAGPPDWNPMIHIPAGFIKNTGQSFGKLDVSKRGQQRHEWPDNSYAARQGSWGLKFNQWLDL